MILLKHLILLHFRLLNDAEIAKSKRDFELKKAAYDVEVQTKKAEAELAYELQAAKTKQRIKDEQMQIKVVERTQEILVQVSTNFGVSKYGLTHFQSPLIRIFINKQKLLILDFRYWKFMKSLIHAQ